MQDPVKISLAIELPEDEGDRPGVDLDVIATLDYYYTPEEPAAGFYPGCPSDVSLNQLNIRGVNVIDLLSEYSVNALEKAIDRGDLSDPSFVGEGCVKATPPSRVDPVSYQLAYYLYITVPE